MQTHSALLFSKGIISTYFRDSLAFYLSSPTSPAEELSGADPRDLCHAADVAVPAKASPKGHMPAGPLLLRRLQESSLT